MKYGVTSGEMWEIVPVLDDGSGPKEGFRNYVEVEARDPIEAKVKAVRTAAFKQWREWQKDDDESPYIGLTCMKIPTKKRG